jgi:hypothetical protein
MPSPQQKLADSLEILYELQNQGTVAIRSRDLSRTHRERLVQNGFLKEVMKGWYIPAHPEETAGESTAWYTSFWSFCGDYLESRFGKEWSLSPEQSLMLHIENRTVPRQLLVRARKGRNHIMKLPHGTSILDVKASLPKVGDAEELEGLRLFALPAALIEAGPAFFERRPTDARAALAMLRDVSGVLEKLLNGGHSVIAGRLAGGLRDIGRIRLADDIVNTMKAAGYKVRETNPFEHAAPAALAAREHSPHVARIRLMWQQTRGVVIEAFPEPPGLPRGKKAFLKRIEDAYKADAYHSLSIEGYRVSGPLIERVRQGTWNPDAREEDRQQRDALAARGYWQAFQAVKSSIQQVLDGAAPGEVANDDHGQWYREMFAPSVMAGLLKPGDLAGYRNIPVYIRRSMHVPPSADAVRDLIPTFFDLLKDEDHPAVRIVLGHFFFVYIHPYMDGNGRIGRFLMNLMLASGGYPWTIIPVERRNDYMAALESASVDQNIEPFAEFLAQLVRNNMEGKDAPGVPET